MGPGDPAASGRSMEQETVESRPEGGLTPISRRSDMSFRAAWRR